MDPLPPLLTTEQLASYLQKPVPTLYAWRHRGEGPPAISVGRGLRYRREDVEAWLESLKAS
jgi:excisionase family DNA binding protein